MSTMRRRGMGAVVAVGYALGYAAALLAELALAGLGLGCWLRSLAEDWNGARCGGVHLPRPRLVLREDALEEEVATEVSSAA